MTLSPIIEWLLKYLLAAGGLGAFLYWVLQRTLDDRLATRLEKTKHELQIDLEKMTVIFEHQKDSLSKVLIAMHAAIRDIEQNVQGPGDWFPIRSKDGEKFKRVVSQECLFLDRNSDQALDIFLKIMWSAVEDPAFDMYADPADVRHAHDQLVFIADQITQHFRNRVGLGPADHLTEPLQDVELLDACRLLTESNFGEFSLPKESPLKFGDRRSASQIVAAARQNPVLLKAELQRLKEAVKASDQGGSFFFFEVIALIDRYLILLDS